MNSFQYDYAVIGGDLRLSYLAGELAAKGCRVCHYALCHSLSQISAAERFMPAASLEAAVNSATCVVCPIPFSKDQVILNQSGIKKNIYLKQMIPLLSAGQHFFAGCIPDEFNKEASKKGVFVFDFMEDASLAYFNTIATAEGVLCEAIRFSPVNLHKSRCAVLGYGKCGRTLTNSLKGMSCHVSVAADPPEELAMAALLADEAMRINAALSGIEAYDFIFNTIPAVTLTRDVLLRVKPSAVILDIASAPGGVDFAAANELSVHAKSCPGLPGTYAPLSSAKAMLASIKNFELPCSRNKECLAASAAPMRQTSE